MSRWSKQVGLVLQETSSYKSDGNFLESFYKVRNYLPANDQEKKEFEEFSLVTSSMAILIHIAEADGVLKAEERTKIVEDLIFQLEQRPYEYDKLSEKFGKYEIDIINNMFDKLVMDYELDQIDLDEIIRVINMVYQNNLEKRIYLLRLCYHVALADFDYDKKEQKVIKEIADKLNIPVKDAERIETEVRKEIEKN